MIGNVFIDKHKAALLKIFALSEQHQHDFLMLNRLWDWSMSLPVPTHEMAICKALLRQVLNLASARTIRPVGRITLRIGPLAGVEPNRIRSVFPQIAAGTVCERAEIEIERPPIQIWCRTCGATSDVRQSRFVCDGCGARQVKLVSGDEMLLARVESVDSMRAEKAAA